MSIGTGTRPRKTARVTRGPAQSTEPTVEPGPTAEWYDRSSIDVDAMVMILDQSPEDFERRAPETRFCDYLDGVVYMPSPASDRHQDLGGFLYVLLRGFCEDRDAGLVLTGPAVLRLGPTRIPEPDVFVRPMPGVAADVPALLVVEVLSNSTRTHDLGRKLAAYRDARIPDVWLIDDRDRLVHAEGRVGEGYRRRSVGSGRLEATGLPGFWIDVDWLWSDPPPKVAGCLRQLLAPRPRGRKRGGRAGEAKA